MNSIGTTECIRATWQEAFPRSQSLFIAFLFLILFSLPSLAQGGGEDKALSTTLSPSIVVSSKANSFPGMAISFDASQSIHSVAEELIDDVRYIWDFGDGVILIGKQVTHRYVTTGVFQVSLTMEVFEHSGIFHRGTKTTEVTVMPAELPMFVTVINLSTGFTSPGVFIKSEGPFVFIAPQPDVKPTTVDPGGDPPPPPEPKPGLGRFVLSGGLLSVSNLRLCDARIAMELADDKWLAFVGFGVNITNTTISLTELYPAIERRGYELVSRVDQANLATLGVGYEIQPDLYLLGSTGFLYIAGAYEGSSRLILDDELLSAPFSDWRSTLSFGLGLRIGWGMLSLQILLVL